MRQRTRSKEYNDQLLESVSDNRTWSTQVDFRVISFAKLKRLAFPRAPDSASISKYIICSSFGFLFLRQMEKNIGSISLMDLGLMDETLP